MSRLYCFFVATIAILFLVPSASAQVGNVDAFQRSNVVVAERTDAGEWTGTWYFVSRDEKIALWIRTTGGQPELQLQYFGSILMEHIVTDWKGQADYDVKGRYFGRFDLNITERDENTIKGSLDWTLTVGETIRTERGNFTMYRAGHGRSLVMKFDDYVRIETIGSEQSEWRSQKAWTFRKASNRLVNWEELPF